MGRADAGGARTQELAAKLRNLGASESELRRALAEAAERTLRARRRAGPDRSGRGEARRRLEAAEAEPAEGDDREALAERAERLRARREELGRVNPLAKEEYEAEKERLDELATQRGRPRGQPRRAGEAPRRAGRDRRDPLRRHLRGGRRATSTRSRASSSPAARDGCA